MSQLKLWNLFIIVRLYTSM